MDLLHDPCHKTWFQIGTAHEKLVPGFVLDSPLLTKEAAEDLPNSLFADEVNRLFPIDNPANTWVSAAYFAKNAAEGMPRYHKDYAGSVEARIMKAAELYGIQEAVAGLVGAVRTKTVEKSAAEDNSNWGWVDGQTRHFPLFDRDAVIKAAAYFEDNRFLYPLEMRRSIARSILNKAGEHKVEVPDVVRREAGYGLPRRDTAMAEILDRAYRCKDASVAEALVSVVEGLADAPMEEVQANLDKLAELIDDVDRQTGLDHQYNKKVLPPADFLFPMDTKVAEALVDDAAELGRHTFSLSKLAELDLSVFSEALGPEFADRVKTASGTVDRSKLADELFSLPAPDKYALEEHLERTYGR